MNSKIIYLSVDHFVVLLISPSNLTQRLRFAILCIFFLRNTLLHFEDHSKLYINLLLLVSNINLFYKYDFPRKYEAKKPRYIGELLLSYEFFWNSICFQPRLKFIFRSISRWFRSEKFKICSLKTQQGIVFLWH